VFCELLCEVSGEEVKIEWVGDAYVFVNCCAVVILRKS